MSQGALASGRGTSKVKAPAADSPEALAGSLAAALVEGEAAAVGAFLAYDSRLLTPDGTEVRGRRGVVSVLAQLATPGQRLSIEAGQTIRTGAVAVCAQRWTLRSETAGTPFERRSTGFLVLRCENGRWWVVIAAPWGVGS
ncbi:MAG TPA: nuclear transport factor 2 family protein [Solirubrobacterales bacterium]